MYTILMFYYTDIFKPTEFTSGLFIGIKIDVVV